MTQEPIRVLIADDHPVYRDGLARLLADLGGFEVAGLAADGAEAVRLADELAPDVIVMDLRMPRLDGIEATRRITTASPHIGIVVLSMFDDEELVFAAVRAGARGYLLKDADDEQVGAVIRGIARGEVIFGAGTAQRLLELLNTTPVLVDQLAGVFPHLTARERDVLELVAQGRNNRSIADALFLSERTVRNYVSNIFSKLQVADRAQAIAAARDVGIGDPSRPRHSSRAGDGETTK
jgi:DNA-binding NarL/FixJ family response regulator